MPIKWKQVDLIDRSEKRFFSSSMIYLAAVQAEIAAAQLSQQSSLLAQHASMGLPTRGGRSNEYDYQRKLNRICI